jgi:HAD superfamily hydrolase (TIGR01509 family)
MLRAVVFDFNGVLVDDEPVHERLFARVLAEEGVDLGPGRYMTELLGLDDRGAFRAALEGAGRSADPPYVARLIARKASYYREAVKAERLPWFEGAEDLVRDCGKAGLLLAVVSGALREEIEGALARAGLRGAFKFVVAAEDVEAGKPDPAGYRLALDNLNQLEPLPERLIHGHEVVAIEDSPQGLIAASAAGLATLGVAHSIEAAALGRADHVVPRLRGLTAARLRRMFA